MHAYFSLSNVKLENMKKPLKVISIDVYKECQNVGIKFILMRDHKDNMTSSSFCFVTSIKTK